MKKLTDTLKNSKSFLLASGTYLLASAVDYAATAYGLNTNQIREVNPIINYFINEFGTNGILIPKIALSGGILSLSKIVDGKKAFCFENFKSKYLLYPVAILTATTGLSWLTHKFFLE